MLTAVVLELIDSSLSSDNLGLFKAERAAVIKKRIGDRSVSARLLFSLQ